MKAAKKVCALGALMGLVMLGLVPGPAQAADPLTVEVSRFSQSVPAEGMRFYAPPLKVEQGQTVTFTSESFHTATLLPANTDVQGWVEDNVLGLGKPWSFITIDPDDTALDPGGSPDTPSLKANNQALFPSSFTCGESGNPCPYDGSSVVNSGAPVADPLNFTVSIDAEVGDTIWVICLIHPHMRLKMTVVDTGEATTQAEVDDFADEASAEDFDEAEALHNKLINKQSKHKTASGKTVWDAWVGYDTHDFTLYAMYPAKLVVRKGQTVRYHFAQSVNEDHTATFPSSTARQVANENFVPGCDPDGDGGAGPDTEPTAPPPIFCAGGPGQLEFDVTPQFAYERGNGVFRGEDYENSGVRGAATSPRDDAWDLKFDKTSGRNPYGYICLIHPFMRGRVAVKPRR